MVPFCLPNRLVFSFMGFKEQVQIMFRNLGPSMFVHYVTLVVIYYALTKYVTPGQAILGSNPKVGCAFTGCFFTLSVKAIF